MTVRGPEATPKPITERHTMSAAELAASALVPDAAFPLRTALPKRAAADGAPKAATAAQAALRQRLLARARRRRRHRAASRQQRFALDLRKQKHQNTHKET